jgi:peptidoglycan/xylan/chitin deacetylase (PgdA/CDA1 family)
MDGPIHGATFHSSLCACWVSLLSDRMRLGGGRSLIKALAAGADAVRPPPPGLVIVIYHRVGRRAPIETDLPTGLFEDQIAFLCEHARIVSLDDGLEALATDTERRKKGERLVAVTFDDGTTDFAEFALPILTRHHVPVTLYVATGFVEEQRSFPYEGVAISWDALRDARSTELVSIGSHTHHHALLDRLPPDAVEDELDRSIELIQERLGVRAEHFAYPKAFPGSAAADRAVRMRFRSAALAGTRANKFGATDPYRLARSPVQVSDGMRWFKRKVDGGLALEDQLRGLTIRVRDRNATT